MANKVPIRKKLTTYPIDFELFFRMSIDAMLVATAEGKIVDFNQAYEKITGYSREELFALNGGWDIIHPEDVMKLKERLELVYDRTSETMNYEIRLQTKKEGLRYVSYDSTLDRINGMLYVIGRDVTERRRQMESIEEGELRFKNIFENSAIGIALFEDDLRLIDVNQTLLNRLGYSPEDLQHQLFSMILHPDDRDPLRNALQSLLSKKVSRTYAERRFIKRDKSITWSKLTMSLLEISPEETMIMALVEDIDSQKKSERALIESEEKFRAVFESSPMGILITRQPGIIEDVNPAFCEMMGFSKADLLGLQLLDITYPADIPATKKMLQRIYEKELSYYVVEKRYVRKEGTSFWARAVVSTMFTGNDSVITVAIVENIDHKRKTEQALEDKNKALTQTNQELEHFAYVASHDLQEPLRTITSFIQILDRKYGKEFDTEAQEYMGFVVDGAKRMQLLIHDLLEYSRINRHHTGYEYINLNEIFITVSHVLKEKIERNDALVLAEELPQVYGNKLLLTQVFQNLIDNAIKFKAPKRKPEIRVSVEDRGDKYELIFRDNGIGISPDYFQRIFVIFQRLHTNDEFTGTGIGLAVCKKIVERHGGEIWVESKEGEGSVFHFTLAKNMLQTVE